METKEISKIKMPDGQILNFKDEELRRRLTKLIGDVDIQQGDKNDKSD